MHKFSALLSRVFKPLGLWGVAALALLDSSMIPIPGSMDTVIIGYVSTDHRALLYCLVAATAAAAGSLVPFYIGRAGGELFLLKRINRERYERLRDRFERQEFVAILLPSMGPPPTPLKVFQFAAGVFEMRPLPFLLATFLGKLAQFLAFALLYLWFGPTVFHSISVGLHRHAGVMLTLGGIVLMALVLYIVRKLFDRRRGIVLPGEEADVAGSENESDDSDPGIA
jgi:membrane protein YqaA with SNARE-associated domain